MLLIPGRRCLRCTELCPTRSQSVVTQLTSWIYVYILVLVSFCLGTYAITNNLQNISGNNVFLIAYSTVYSIFFCCVLGLTIGMCSISDLVEVIAHGFGLIGYCVISARLLLRCLSQPHQLWWEIGGHLLPMPWSWLTISSEGWKANRTSPLHQIYTLNIPNCTYVNRMLYILWFFPSAVT